MQTKINLILLVCLILISLNIGAQNDDHAAMIKECEELIVKKMESDHLVGVSAAIIVNDSVIWIRRYREQHTHD